MKDNNKTVDQLIAENTKLKNDIDKLEISAKEQALIEKKLSLENERNRNLLEFSPVCTKVVDLDFNLQYMSSSGVRDLKIDNITDYYGKPYPLHFYPDSFKIPMRMNLKKVKDDGVTIIQEAPIVDTNGAVLWYQSIIVPVHNTKGQIDYMMVLSLEISERKQAELALQEKTEEARLMAEMLNSSSQPFAVGKPDGTLTNINPAFCKLTGYSKNELLGDMTWNETLTPPEWREHEGKYLQELLKTGQPKSFDKEYIHKNGKRIAVSLLMHRSVDADDNIESIYGFITDISQRKQAELEKLNFEKQILQTQKLESLGVLAGGIAHDFNNILMGILGYADLALSDLDPIDPVREFVQGINDSTRKAAGLVKQLLAYSGKGKFSLEPIDLNHLIDDTVQMLEISISKSAILKFNNSNSQVFLEGDPSQIRQIIMNLVINASDAVGDKSGVIAVTTGSMFCDHDYINDTGFTAQIAHTDQINEGMYIFVEVSDTGTGMSKDTIARIFEPFYTTKFTGRGLGLSAVLGIVRGHHGMVKIYSEERKGTTFKVLFPLFESVDSSSKIDDLDAIDQDWKGEGTFLIADDEEAVRTVGKHMIKRLGFEVLTAENGKEAIEIFKKHQADIVGVLLDLTMPHKDGAEVFSVIRKLNPDAKVILTSGYNEQDATQRFVGKGLAGFIQKPYVAKQLVKKIIDVMG